MAKPIMNQGVTMINNDVRGARTEILSPDLRIHWYEPGDEQWWIEIHELANHHNEITPKLFSNQFTHVELNLSNRQCYLLDRHGHAIATGTAWAESQGRFAGYGRLHWVAVVPAFQNRGIGTMLVSILCQQLIALGYICAFLTTSSDRSAAIHVYEKFGFRIDGDDERR